MSGGRRRESRGTPQCRVKAGKSKSSAAVVVVKQTQPGRNGNGSKTASPRTKRNDCIPYTVDRLSTNLQELSISNTHQRHNDSMFSLLGKNARVVGSSFLSLSSRKTNNGISGLDYLTIARDVQKQVGFSPDKKEKDYENEFAVSLNRTRFCTSLAMVR